MVSSVITLIFTILLLYKSPKYIILLTATSKKLVLFLLGGWGIWLAATYAFIADISEPDQKAFRMGMLHVVGSFSSPIGTPIGMYLFKSGKLV